MKYLSFINIVCFGLLLVCCHDAVGQNNSLRKSIVEGYNAAHIQTLIQTYKREKLTDSIGGRALWTGNRQRIEIDALGNQLYYKTTNQISASTARVNELNSGGVTGLDLNGEGMIVGMWDAGIPKYDHEDLMGKITIKDDSNYTNITRHATHVSGTLVASGVNEPEGRGLIPNAHLWVSNWTDDLEEMIKLAGQGLLVSNHSYGLDPEKLPEYYFGAYTKTTQAVDAMTYNMKYYQPVVAAGNDRNKYSEYNPKKEGRDLLTAMAVSKNAVVVAAVTPVVNYHEAQDVLMTNFSNWGPTDDFRVKPDISAQGVNVLSTVDTSTTDYDVLSGTSMAAPAVSSVFSLWQQYYGRRHNYTKALTSASIRGIMAHTADEAGLFPGPDYQFGWGLINARRGVDFIRESIEGDFSFLEETILAQGEEDTYQVKLNTSKDKLVITLAWTDKEGVEKLGKIDDSTPDLVNDLNVLVQKGSILYYPWRLKKDQNDPVAERGINDVDNIEKIEIPNAEAGEYTIKVSHSKKLFLGEQDYSILISGMDSVSQDIAKFSKRARVWPNPASDYLSMSLGEGDMNGGSVNIYDLNGKNVLQIDALETNRNQVSKIDISMLKTGVYVVSFKKGGTKEVFKVIKL
ncbi:S8/S53 family peptidase [Flavobacterium sp. HSC-61S13]|uniref:S8/S53 family peptidase n=1 Tax=Flavobacterium sp. HSC-61S13 TaxID=2910963 RepID=UPI00209F739D|nr:S8/S53 family peptidase [Flavobacterium sp. HSC-61S13]MCP1994884.1 hypothetical protein [Flavobacterium sp. HSC-61S13]